MSAPKFQLVAFVNSDTLIKAFIEKDKTVFNKLVKFGKEMDVEIGEKMLITDFVINDIVNEAYKKGVSKNKLFNFIFPGKTIYFQTVSVPPYVLKHAVYYLDETPDDIKLNLTEWTGLLMMIEWDIDTIISDNVEIDKIIHDPELYSIFKKRIRRI